MKSSIPGRSDLGSWGQTYGDGLSDYVHMLHDTPSKSNLCNWRMNLHENNQIVAEDLGGGEEDIVRKVCSKGSASLKEGSTRLFNEYPFFRFGVAWLQSLHISKTLALESWLLDGS